MTRNSTPETKSRIRRSPLPAIGAVVAIILVVFYGWSQRGWLENVADIESRDVDMQTHQLERGFEAELKDLFSAVGDYAIWSETAEFVRGNRPDYFPNAVNAGSLVRLDVDDSLEIRRQEVVVVEAVARQVPIRRRAVWRSLPQDPCRFGAFLGKHKRTE